MFLTPGSSYKQSNFQSSKKSDGLGTFEGDYCKTSPSADGVSFSQNAPCELTLPGAYISKATGKSLEENSSGTILKHVKSVESVLCDKHKFSSYVSY